MILIYLPKITSRNRYCIRTVMNNFLKIQDFDITSDDEYFIKFEGCKFSYSPTPLSDELHFWSSGILEKRGIVELPLNVGNYKNVPTLFHDNSISASLPFDVFSAIFFMLSRYEEYLPHLRDHYDRYTAKESIAFKNGFLKIAVVDRWAENIKEELLKKFSEISFEKRAFEFIPTIDIDNAYAHKEKGIFRTLASYLQLISRFNFSEITLKTKILAGKEKDPFDTYNYQLNLQKHYKLNPIYFILLGDYGLNDKNISYENRNFQSLIKSLADYTETGIHPSFGSNDKPEQLTKEIERLQNIVKKEVVKSRQHFLKLRLPETYRNLIENDIEEDYTMGFASHIGFRAGTCTPYPFYDLDEEVERRLMVFPFQVMESTFKYYLKYNIEQSFTEIKEVIDEVSEVGGTFISLWHNESLSNKGEWENWKTLYEQMIEYAVSKIESD